MSSGIANYFQNEPTKRWAAYLIKALALIAVLFIVGRFGPDMPPICLAILWALLSAASAIGAAYHFVMRKVRNRYGLKSGGILARVNSGRIVRLIIAFILSAVFIGGLFLELPKWELAEWLMLVLSVPVYVVIYWCVARFVKTQYEPTFQVSKAVVLSSFVLFVILLVVYLLISRFEPVAAYSNLTEAFLGAKKPFEHSSSVLLSDVGYYVALVDGLSSFAMTRVAEVSLEAYVVWRVVLCFSTAAAISSLVGSCSLEFAELKLLFFPLEAVDGEDDGLKPLKACIAVACILPALLLACWVGADAKAAQIAETEEYSAAKSFVREQVGMAAYVIDGKPYDYERVRELYDEVRKRSKELADEREYELGKLINATFDARLANVDPYLDWYYSLPADYERLMQTFTNTIEEGMQRQLEERINEGVDENKLEERLDYYLNASLELKEEAYAELAKYELVDYELGSISDWLIKPVESVRTGFLDEPLAPTQSFLDTGERMGLSSGAGLAAGFIATKATQKILAKPFFRKIVASLTEKLAARGLLAAGGTALAPGLGTLVGIGVGFMSDYLFLKADESMNRAAYREEIVAAIEEGRQEMQDLVASDPLEEAGVPDDAGDPSQDESGAADDAGEPSQDGAGADDAAEGSPQGEAAGSAAAE